MDVIQPELKPEAAGSSDNHVRTYELWEGNNVFGLKGRLIFGPDARSIVLTILMIVIPASVFCTFVASKLMDDFPHHLGILIMVVFVLLTLFVLIVLLLTSGRDPGIIPRYSSSPEIDNFDGIVRVMNSHDPQMQKPPMKEVIINGISVKIKYCDTCKLYRPPRCSHCSICNNCVERFDHHCPWVGQCIGLRNYRFYFIFVSSATLLCLYVFGFCWVYVKRIMDGEEVSVWKALVKTPASIVLIIYTFLLVWFVGGLTVFHSYLISTNQTTYENFRFHYDKQDNPFHKGMIGNFKEVLFSSIPPSKNHFRAKITKGSEYPSRRVDKGILVGEKVGKADNDLEVGIKPIWDDILRGEGSYEGDFSGVDGVEKSGEAATEIVELKQASSRKAPHMPMLLPSALEEDLHTPKIEDTDFNR